MKIPTDLDTTSWNTIPEHNSNDRSLRMSLEKFRTRVLSPLAKPSVTVTSKPLQLNSSHTNANGVPYKCDHKTHVTTANGLIVHKCLINCSFNQTLRKCTIDGIPQSLLSAKSSRTDKLSQTMWASRK